MKSNQYELESRCINMQKEMDGMRDKLSRMDELEEKCQQHEEKCNTLEDRCDSLQRSVEILSKESTWEYSAPSLYPIAIGLANSLMQNTLEIWRN